MLRIRCICHLQHVTFCKRSISNGHLDIIALSRELIAVSTIICKFNLRIVAVSIHTAVVCSSIGSQFSLEDSCALFRIIGITNLIESLCTGFSFNLNLNIFECSFFNWRIINSYSRKSTCRSCSRSNNRLLTIFINQVINLYCRVKACDSCTINLQVAQRIVRRNGLPLCMESNVCRRSVTCTCITDLVTFGFCVIPTLEITCSIYRSRQRYRRSSILCIDSVSTMRIVTYGVRITHRNSLYNFSATVRGSKRVQSLCCVIEVMNLEVITSTGSTTVNSSSCTTIDSKATISNHYTSLELNNLTGCYIPTEYRSVVLNLQTSVCTVVSAVVRIKGRTGLGRKRIVLRFHVSLSLICIIFLTGISKDVCLEVNIITVSLCPLTIDLQALRGSYSIQINRISGQSRTQEPAAKRHQRFVGLNSCCCQMLINANLRFCTNLRFAIIVLDVVLSNYREPMSLKRIVCSYVCIPIKWSIGVTNKPSFKLIAC